MFNSVHMSSISSGTVCIGSGLDGMFWFMYSRSPPPSAVLSRLLGFEYPCFWNCAFGNSVVCRIMERLIKNVLTDHLLENKLFTPDQ